MRSDPSRELPAELRAFLHSCIDSIDEVELLMMLRGSSRFRAARDVATEFRVSISAARQHLETLSARGLLEVRVDEETLYRYQPKSDELARYCDLLAQHYITSRQDVLGFVATQSRLSAKRFSDAFKLRDSD